MHVISEQERILAGAILEIRVLLSGFLDSSAKDNLAVREAAFLAYALHNRALESLAGQSFDVHIAFAGIARIDELLSTNIVYRLSQAGVMPPA